MSSQLNNLLTSDMNNVSRFAYPGQCLHDDTSSQDSISGKKLFINENKDN